MAEQLSGAEKDSLKRYREIRAEAHFFVSSLVNHIVAEVKTNGFNKNGRAELNLRLVGLKFVELRKLDEKIGDIAPAHEVVEYIKTSNEFYSSVLKKITDAISGIDDKELMLASLQYLSSLFQMP